MQCSMEFENCFLKFSPWLLFPHSASNDSLAGNVDDPEGALDALMQVCVLEDVEDGAVERILLTWNINKVISIGPPSLPSPPFTSLSAGDGV